VICRESSVDLIMLPPSGVDAIWLTPFYESPMKDLGYDITDMLDIDPLFGVMKDFEELLSICPRYGAQGC